MKLNPHTHIHQWWWWWWRLWWYVGLASCMLSVDECLPPECCVSFFTVMFMNFDSFFMLSPFFFFFTFFLASAISKTEVSSFYVLYWFRQFLSHKTLKSDQIDYSTSILHSSSPFFFFYNLYHHEYFIACSCSCRCLLVRVLVLEWVNEFRRK